MSLFRYSHTLLATVEPAEATVHGPAFAVVPHSADGVPDGEQRFAVLIHSDAFHLVDSEPRIVVETSADGGTSWAPVDLVVSDARKIKLVPLSVPTITEVVLASQVRVRLDGDTEEPIEAKVMLLSNGAFKLVRS